MLYNDGQVFVMTMSLPVICSISLHQQLCLLTIRVVLMLEEPSGFQT